MFKFTAPACAGFSEDAIHNFFKEVKKRKINFHSVLMAKGDNIFFEKYWAPFDENKPHRMYSVTKSFVAIAVGFLEQEGKISLNDPIIKYFPDKLPEYVHPYLEKQTIRNMLMMSTCFQCDNWFRPGIYDRTKFYFAQKVNRPAGTIFDYDSTGSYILGALVERVSGMKLIDYLKEKVLNRIGGFENAEILEVPDGVAWGDSALVCKPRGLMNFAKFVMNKGVWEGERLLNEEYLTEATKPLIDNNLEGMEGTTGWGYGYQIWMTEQNGFAFNGMGCQFAICVPDKDFIFVCTGDNQYNSFAGRTIFRAVFDYLIPEEYNLPEEDYRLPVAFGCAHTDFEKKISGKTFVCDENEMGMTDFRFDFDGDEGVFTYHNAQGEKALPFGLKKNVFGKFPQLGYSDGRGNVHEITEFKYECAASAGWIEDKKLQLRVQIIDRYFGSMTATFGYLDDKTVGVRTSKNAEDFLSEYQGWTGAKSE